MGEECEQSQLTCVMTQVEDASHRRTDGLEDTASLPLRVRRGGDDNREGREEGGNPPLEKEGTVRGPKSGQGSDGDERMSDKTERMSDKTDGSAIVICSQSDSDQGEKASSSVRQTRKKRPAIIQSSSEDEDTDSPSSHPPSRKRPGRPAKSIDQVGQHTAQKRRERKQLYKKNCNIDLALSIASGTETVDKTTRRFRLHERKMKECSDEFATAPVQDVLNTLEGQVHAIMCAASKGAGLQGGLQKVLYTAASTLEAGAKALASRTGKGHYDPRAGRAPSPINVEVEELREANRRLLEELQNARREIEERNRTSPPPSPVITRARAEKEEKMEEDENGEELGGIFPSLIPSPDIPRPSREELAAYPANRPPIQGVSKRLEDPQYPAITSNKILQGDEAVTTLGQIWMGQMREEWRKEMREMRELIEMRLPPPSLPNPTPSESPSGSGPPFVKAVAPPTGDSRKEGGKKGKKVPKQRSVALQQPTVGPPPPPKEKKRDPSKKPGPPTPPGEVKNTTAASTAVAPREAESWTTVVKKGKKKPPPSKGEGSKTASKPSPTPSSQEAGKKGGKKKRRAPRTAAIMLTCPGGEYAATMRHVQEKIPLKELGITGPLKPNTAQTGAMLIELLGLDKREKADRLASKMADLFADRPEIRIARPQKMGEIRINGKDPSITPDDIARAVVEQGGCSLIDIKVGDIREMGRGQRTAWVQCPLEAATKVAQVGHLKIRWFTHRVELLSARPLQCYKCLEKGHVQAKCPSGSVDRSKCCYRCGTEGHEARTCTAPARCTLCHEAGRQASHRMLGPACKAPKNGGKRKKGGATQAPPPQNEGKKKEQAAANLPALEGPCPPEAMECEPTTSQCPAVEDTRMISLQE
ncbi:uncharacterized protein [Linepithema humile]|uniref:uncharacterized protein n=1 Tax=Linepithema humile TaxID=83485 RepID=UPI00351ED14C